MKVAQISAKIDGKYIPYVVFNNLGDLKLNKPIEQFEGFNNGEVDIHVNNLLSSYKYIVILQDSGNFRNEDIKKL